MDSLRVLLLEDVSADAELVTRELRRAFQDCAVRVVDDREPFVAALKEFSPQVILSDHRLATFNGMEALELVKQELPDVPFIFVTGSLDEETAVGSIKAGAWDYILKERLARLGSAVSAALELRRARDELKRSQEQFLHAQKLEAVGRLAGGLAHDYNNLTFVIQASSRLLAEGLPRDHPLQLEVGEIAAAAQRAGELTRQLLSFSRRQPMQAEPVHLNSVVQNLERMVKRLIGADIVVDVQLGEQVGWIRADPSQIEQALVNLVVNARDAMPNGGRLILVTRVMEFPPQPTTPGEKPERENWVSVAVRDTGAGMDEATQQRIFEPFFTTKGPGKGTGLGLSTVYGIVEQSGGHVRLNSRLGVGTTFELCFPELSVRNSAPQLAEVAPVSGGTESILIVDDHDGARRVTARLLMRYGYHVVEARDGTEALAMARKRAPDLVIADLVLPGMGGREIVARLREMLPHVPVIYASGYADPDVIREAQKEANTVFLQKPVPTDELARRVRQMLEL